MKTFLLTLGLLFCVSFVNARDEPATGPSGTVCESAGGSCKDLPDGIKIGYKNDCTKFIQCFLECGCDMECPAGLHFNSKKQVCDWPTSAKCDPSYDGPGTGPSGVCESGGELCKNMTDGTSIAYNNDCTKYIVCLGGCEISTNCPSGTHFSAELKQCTFPSEAGCDSSENFNPSPPSPSPPGPSTPGPSPPGPSPPGPSPPGPSPPGPSPPGPSPPGPSPPGPSPPGPSPPGPSPPGPSPPGTCSPATPGSCTPGPCTPGSCTPGPCSPSPCTPNPCTPGSCAPGPCSPSPCTPSPCTPRPCAPGPCTPGPSPPGPSTGPSGLNCKSSGESCKNMTDGTFIASPNDCNNYIECLEGCEINRNCPNGTHFSEKYKQCMLPFQAGCDSSYENYQPPIPSPNPTPCPCATASTSITSSSKQAPGPNSTPASNTSPIPSKKPSPTKRPIPSSKAPSQTAKPSTSQSFKPPARPIPRPDVQSSCSGREPGTLLPFIGNCGKFVACGEGTVYIMDCGPGLHFNAPLEICDWPEQAGCDPLYVNSSCQSKGASCLGKDNGKLLPYAGVCEWFVACFDGCAHDMACGQGLHFNKYSEVCDLPEDAGCDLTIPSSRNVHNRIRNKFNV